MTLNQRLIPLLLLGLTVTSGVTNSLCTLSEDRTRCVCNVMDIRNPESIICVQALELELRDGNLDGCEMANNYPNFAFQLIQKNRVIFNNVTTFCYSVK